MIHPVYSLDEIETRFFNYLTGQVGSFIVSKHLEVMNGGNEAYLYRFQIRGVEGLEKPLVLRLFPSRYDEGRSEWQGMIHNLMSDEGIPVPRVHFTSTDKNILGGSFMVLDFVEGKAIDPGEDPSILALTAKTQAKLHEVDGKKVLDKIVNLGHNPEAVHFNGHMNWLREKVDRYPQVKEIFQWLENNKPDDPVKLSIVHGDFHPMNLMVEDGKVLGVLDWSGFHIGDAMTDLGWTLGLFYATAKHEMHEDMFNQLIQLYLDSYESIRHYDRKSVDYYISFRLAQALVEGLDGQAVWARSEFVKNMVSELKERTGVTVSI